MSNNGKTILNNGEEGRKTWNERAKYFKDRQIPGLDNGFVKSVINACGPEMKTMTVLDLGCGTGIWSLCFADRVKSITGVDISDNMIDYANANKDAAGVSNAEYIRADWQDPVVRKSYSKSKFDIVIAHKTPAISCEEDIKHMDSICSGICFYTTTAFDDVPLIQNLCDMYGIEAFIHRPDLCNICSTLFRMKRYPWLFYDEIDRSTSSTPEQIVERFRIPEGPKSIELMNYLKSISVNGMVSYTAKMTQVTLAWRTNGSLP